jgi:16S rRNA (cytosine1402-N4)-methyltransferase
MSHMPVMKDELLSLLSPKPGCSYMDCTVGIGGHAEAIMEAVKGNALLIGIDKDPESIELARERLSRFGENVKLFHGDFRDLRRISEMAGVNGFDGVVFDLGISSFQLDNPERGFSFRLEGPLDMRMDRSSPFTAFDVVNGYPERKLFEVIRDYGEERWARRIAKAICREREKGPIRTTLQLARIIEEAVPGRWRHGRIHPATRTFQAIRIEVNGELKGLGDAIRDAVDLLLPGGRICVISFHSLEDRIVKNAFKDISSLTILTKKPLRPKKEEVDRNPRCRSARLRAAEKKGG